MKQMEETIQAVRDWVESRKRIISRETERDFLKKTGDASKVTNIFTTYSSRTLPASGESLDITIGKIRKYLSDLGAAAYSSTTPTRDYDNLSYKPIRSNFLLDHMATTEAYDGGYSNSNADNALLIYGVGGASTSAAPRGKVDFFRAYLVACDKFNASSGIYTAKSVQLGSLGSTARWTLYPSGMAYAEGSGFNVSIRIPKGSWANVQVLRIPLYTQYANSK